MKMVKLKRHDDSNCYYEQLHVDFKICNPKMQPLFVDIDTFDPKSIKKCQIEYNGFYIVPKVKTESASKKT